VSICTFIFSIQCNNLLYYFFTELNKIDANLSTSSSSQSAHATPKLTLVNPDSVVIENRKEIKSPQTNINQQTTTVSSSRITDLHRGGSTPDFNLTSFTAFVESQMSNFLLLFFSFINFLVD
jgi:hypothetical protein